MKNNEFKKKFITIANRHWIKGVNSFTSASGLTFENELGKKADSMYFPDYYGTEIKTTTRFSGFPFSLFNLAFDGPKLFETNRILQEYGKNDFKYSNTKLLIGSLNTKYPSKITNYSFLLDVDKKERKVYLCVFDQDENLIERQAYIYFDTIIDRIKLKLSNLIVVYASKKSINNEIYFRYYAYKKYILKKNVDIFDLIDKNIIKVDIVCRVSRSGNEEGRQRNKGLVFKINKKDILYLFDCVETYDNDSMSKYEDNDIGGFNIIYI